MPVTATEVIDAVSVLTDDANMKVTLKQSGKGAIICGATCFVGGIVGGPIGLAVGGMLGGLGAAALTHGTFKPVSEIIKNDLTPGQKEELSTRVMNVVREIHPSDIVVLLPLILGNPSMQQAVLRTVTSFITGEMRLQIVD
uniref:Putative conserved plasma membrane protein n=1 Tax=Tabanus bromius TaxID=304241 RepID=A0A0K8TQN5_TABBR